MEPGDLTIRHAQATQPWTVPYSDGVVRAAGGDVPHLLATHTVLHAVKSLGKVSLVLERLDHSGPDRYPPTRADMEAVRDATADLMTAAVRLANLSGFDLAAALVERVREKNGAAFPDRPAGYDGRTPARLLAESCHRWPDGAVYLPPHLTGRERRRFLRQLLRLEAVVDDPGELNRRRQNFSRAGGQVTCPQCGEAFADHPADVDGEPDTFSGAGLVILCDKDRVKL